MEIRAADDEATSLTVLGRREEAWDRHAWIVGAAKDPAHMTTITDEDVAHDVVNAFCSWAAHALDVPGTRVDEVFETLDAERDPVRAHVLLDEVRPLADGLNNADCSRALANLWAQADALEDPTSLMDRTVTREDRRRGRCER